MRARESVCTSRSRGSGVRWSASLLALLTLPPFAVSADPATHSRTDTAALASSAIADPSRWPTVQWPLREDAALEQRVSALLRGMTLEQKVGQIVQADIGSVTPAEVRRFHLGSVLAGGNSDPGGDYRASASQWLALADEYHAASIDRSEGGAGIPILFGIDAVHGHNNVVGATLFPHNIGLGATRNPELVRRISEATAREIRATGMEWSFAPALSVPRDDRWGRTYEGYSEDPALVAVLGRAAVEGLQGRVGSKEFLDGAHVLATAKHFIADGGTGNGTDQGDANIEEDRLRDIHGAGYVTALAAGAQTVMASFSSWNGVKIHGNASLLQDVLRGPLGFGGFVVGDWNAHGQVPGCSNTRCAAAFNAGVDMLMTPDSWRGFYESALAQARTGEIPIARLDQAVARILRVKLRLGLFEQGAPSARPLGGRFTLLGHPEHRAIARQAVRESLVLLKNSGRLLPLDPRQRILVAGDGADNVMKQAGGWTLTWQGTGVTPEDFPGAESIWHGLRQHIVAAGGHAELSADGVYHQRPDVAIVVIGESPYAEFQGDLDSLDYVSRDDSDLKLLQRLKADGIPVVTLFLSGRPLWVNPELNASDAFVAAWLPGSEGGGVADVVLRAADGRIRHRFRGRLAFSWPRHPMQTPLNIDDRDYDPLFGFGFGLQSNEKSGIGLLPENFATAPATARTGVWFEQGSMAAGSGLLVSVPDAQRVPVTSLPFERDGLRISAVDHLAQEDARRLQWSADSDAALSITSAEPVDLERQANGDVALVVTLRVERAPAGSVWLSLLCADACDARVALNDALSNWPSGQWLRVAVPLKCLRRAGASLQRVESPLRLMSDSALDISISRVALGTEFDRLQSCPAG